MMKDESEPVDNASEEALEKSKVKGAGLINKMKPMKMKKVMRSMPRKKKRFMTA